MTRSSVQLFTLNMWGIKWERELTQTAVDADEMKSERTGRGGREKRFLISGTMIWLFPLWLIADRNDKHEIGQTRRQKITMSNIISWKREKNEWSEYWCPPNCKRLSRSYTQFTKKSISICFIILCIPAVHVHSCCCTVPCRPANYPYLVLLVIEIMDWGALLARHSSISPAMPSTCSAFPIKMAPWSESTLCLC